MKIFTGHPGSVGETYFQHGLKSLGYALKLLKLSFVCLIHAIFPFLFEKTASVQIRSLNQEIVSRPSNNILKDLSKARHPTS